MKKFTLFLSTLLFSMMSFGAPLGEGYSKVTDITTLSAGDKVVLYCDDAELGITGWDGNKTATAATTGWVEYVVEAAEGGVLLKDTDKYIALTAKNAFYYNETGSVCKVNATGVLYITFNGADYLLYENANNGNPLYRMYVDKTGNAQYKPFYVYLVGEGGNTTPDDGGETPDDGGETPEVTADTITCAEAVAICQETGETATSVEYTVRGYVTNIKYAWSEKFGTATFWIADTKDGGDVLQAYNCAPLKDADKVFAVGAYVELVGKLKKYGTTNEVEKGTYTVITPAEGGQTPDDGGETPVDTITVAAGLALTDNATCVLNPFTVIYVSGAYVYIEDESAYALLYQYESGLKAGDQVSGMEVTKTTYQDIAQFKPTTMENLTIVAGTAPAIDEITTAPTVADNHLVKLMNVTLAGAIAAGKTVVATCNDNTTINIYSKFDFTIEEGKSYNIIGGVTQYNGTIQIQAYEVEETIGAPSAIDNITINQNATKFIKNGQLFIVKDGVRYNALGQVTK